MGQIVGNGGMGVVCSGWHQGLNIPVAVKFLIHTFKDNEEAIIRFKREAVLCASLEDPNLLRVFDCDSIYDIPYIVMEWVHGRDFEQIVNMGYILSEEEAVTVLRDVGQALLEMHGLGIVHRDIKPANIMLRARDGRIKLADLGIASSQNHNIELTQGVLGTPAYMSPEQIINSSQVTGSSDIFSLGVTIYNLITGVNPFKGKTQYETLSRIVEMPLEFPDSLFNSISNEMIHLLGRLTNKNISERMSSVHELLSVLPKQSFPFKPEMLNIAYTAFRVEQPFEENSGSARVKTPLETENTRERDIEKTYVEPGCADFGGSPKSILFCQCLQNDFILPVGRGEALPNKLHIGWSEAIRIVGQDPKTGPLVRVVSACERSEQVGIVHIRDWHDKSDPLQTPELDFFGSHCLIGTPGARFIDAIEQLSRNRARGAIVESSSINDFEGTSMNDVIDSMVGSANKENMPVGVIGVWTNVKIHYLLYDLKTRANMHNLAVCSSLVASPNRAAHQQSLRHFEEILGVKIIHDVEDFLDFLQVDHRLLAR